MSRAMKPLVLAALAVSCLIGAARAADAPVAPFIAAALADPARPEADRARDAARKAAEVAAFAGVKPGDKVADLFPGGGYFTRVFAKIVGPQGHVYAVVNMASKASDALGSDPAFPNVRVAAQPWDMFSPPETLDVVFNSQFFHDLYSAEYGVDGGGPAGVAKVNRAIFKALKPGGVYLVIDHAGRPGTGVTEIGTLHRIEEPAAVKSLTEAGFVLDGETDILRNPADPRTAMVFDPSIRGKTDQFVLRFRKPN